MWNAEIEVNVQSDELKEPKGNWIRLSLSFILIVAVMSFCPKGQNWKGRVIVSSKIKTRNMTA